jgi:hypothetical protein
MDLIKLHEDLIKNQAEQKELYARIRLAAEQGLLVHAAKAEKELHMTELRPAINSGKIRGYSLSGFEYFVERNWIDSVKGCMFLPSEGDDREL